MSFSRSRMSLLLIPVAALLFAVPACKKSGPDKPGQDSSATAGTTAAGSTAGGANDATEAKNIQGVRDFYEKVFNQGDTAAIATYCSPDFVDHNPEPGAKPGLAGLRDMVIAQREAFPDLKLTVNDIFASGDKVIARVTLTGTQTGKMHGMAPCNKKISVEAIDIIRLANDKGVERWGQFDVMGMMTQLGMMPGGDHAAMGGDKGMGGDHGAMGGTDSSHSAAPPASK